jgi:hypothetical protein
LVTHASSLVGVRGRERSGPVESLKVPGGTYCPGTYRE